MRKPSKRTRKKADVPAESPQQSAAHGKKKPGRKAFVPTETERSLVKLAMAIGFTTTQVGRLIRPQEGGVSADTVQRHFKEEVAHGLEFVTAAVANSLFAKAIGNSPQSVTAAIFWLKSRAGWKDRDFPPVAAHLKVKKDGEDDGGGGEGGGSALPAGHVIEFTLALGDKPEN